MHINSSMGRKLLYITCKITKGVIRTCKIASTSVMVINSSDLITSNSSTNEDHLCVHCHDLTNSIHQLTTELETAHLIISYCRKTS